MFMGEYRHNIDAKGRIIVPAKLRSELGEHFVIINGFEGCLAAYTMQGWEEYSAKLLSLPSSQKAARYLKRELFASAQEVEPDKQGKVLLASQHRNAAEILKEVVVIGAGDHVEIWAAEKWDAYIEDEPEMSLEDAAAALEGFDF